jgi:Integrase zinc binding domain
MLQAEQGGNTRDGIPDGTPNGLSSTLQDGFIYTQNTEILRLCLPRSFEKDVFRLAHDELGHLGFHRAYTRITETIYLHRLTDGYVNISSTALSASKTA